MEVREKGREAWEPGAVAVANPRAPDGVDRHETIIILSQPSRKRAGQRKPAILERNR